MTDTSVTSFFIIYRIFIRIARTMSETGTGDYYIGFDVYVPLLTDMKQVLIV